MANTKIIITASLKDDVSKKIQDLSKNVENEIAKLERKQKAIDKVIDNIATDKIAKINGKISGLNASLTYIESNKFMKQVFEKQGKTKDSISANIKAKEQEIEALNLKIKEYKELSKDISKALSYKQKTPEFVYTKGLKELEEFKNKKLINEVDFNRKIGELDKKYLNSKQKNIEIVRSLEEQKLKNLQDIQNRKSEAINYLNQKILNEKEIEFCEHIISIICEPILKRQLQKILDSKRLSKVDRIDEIEENIKKLQEELENLKNDKK